jgi:hypothetical protein
MIASFKNGVMQNHHLTSVSTSPKFFARCIFLAVGPISGKYTMLYLFLLVTVVDGVAIVNTNTGYFTYNACRQYETINTHCTPQYIQLSTATSTGLDSRSTVYTV